MYPEVLSKGQSQPRSDQFGSLPQLFPIQVHWQGAGVSLVQFSLGPNWRRPSSGVQAPAMPGEPHFSLGKCSPFLPRACVCVSEPEGVYTKHPDFGDKFTLNEESLMNLSFPIPGGYREN